MVKKRGERGAAKNAAGEGRGDGAKQARREGRGGEGGRREGGRRPLARWQKLALAASAAIAVLGLALMVAAWITGDGAAGTVAPEGAPPSTTYEGDAPPAGFMPTDGTQPTAPTARPPAAAQTSTDEVDSLDAWSPAIFRAGFGFFVGFAIAYAMRAFVKISMVVVGLALLGLFGLQYAGVVDVNWSAMEQHYDTIAAWLGRQTESFMRFVTGYIPSTAAALGGLVVGFRRG